ncbi:MAG: type II toxin-antitoxin system RelE/ParE family toxin [Planctomycetes bacterium]|nr:type II toxin-antitoxin system RelE/ParE family toxin [Planctomycetota bacterium]
MSLPVILRPEAEADVLAAHAALEQAQTGLGAQFSRRLRDVLERIEAMPQLYGIIAQDVRAARLRKFRYIVYYVIISERVEVLAVLHSSRDSSAWQSRA